MCKKELSVSRFKKNSHHKDGLQSQCIDCQKEYRRQHYLKNREKYKKKARKRDKQFRAWWKEYKSQFSCSRCGEDHPACIQFHHPEDKDASVSELVACGNKEKVLEEVKKCEPLCANCHFKEHWQE